MKTKLEVLEEKENEARFLIGYHEEQLHKAKVSLQILADARAAVIEGMASCQ